ncbi:MAG: hypothetical protein K9I85_14300 [Saprospiraceae bacterium]|nr:hypothetical protein [Saprospiraceae bacterium]
MTPKQEERIRTKIKRIKAALAAERRMFGGYYDDSRGLRYAPPELYLKLQDYTGALRYFNWFHKNFEDDVCYGTFLFEWTLTLFKTKRIKEAEKKAIATFFANTYLLDYFLEKPPRLSASVGTSNWDYSQLVDHFQYKKDSDELVEFAAWLAEVMESDQFVRLTNRFIEIERKLETEPVGPKRSMLVRERSSLLDDFE